jgi:GTPase
MSAENVSLKLRAGKGGDGAVAWIKKKYIPKGGPCGGNGGKGGSVIIRATSRMRNLEKYTYKDSYNAEDGQSGGVSSRTGKKGNDLVLEVPIGTEVIDADTQMIVADLVNDNQTFILCQGGRGGLGNEFFKSPTNQAPTKSTPGKRGQEANVTLDFKMVGDIALIGMPNSGKSSLINALTHANSKVGDYLFTTQFPITGVYGIDKSSQVSIIDVPSIMKGSTKGKGLGANFLKHCKRASKLAFVIDGSTESADNILETFDLLSSELRAYDPSYARKEVIVIFTKSDKEQKVDEIKAFHEKQSHKSIVLSSQDKETLNGFKQALVDINS